MSAAETITDHAKIKKWAEDRGGRPSKVKTADAHDGSGLLRFDFQDPDENLEEISWDEFFKIFDDNKLAFLEQEETKDGSKSRFCKFVNR